MTENQKRIIDCYVKEFPHLQELAERAKLDPKNGYRTLGNAMAMIPYPSWVTGKDAAEIGKIGIDKSVDSTPRA